MRTRLVAALAAMLLLALLVPASSAIATTSTVSTTGELKGYLVVLKGDMTTTGFTSTVPVAQVTSLITTAGGMVANDLSGQIGVLYVLSANETIDETLRATGLVEVAGEDFSWKALPDAPPSTAAAPTQPAPDPGDDPGEIAQWDMTQIRADQAHDIQAGRPEVQVGVLDSGIDGDHPEFFKGADGNVRCELGRDFVPVGPSPLSIGTPCDDNQFHGTHVAGTIGARVNGIGIVGVAPNVSLIPVKVCDTAGYCYASSAVQAITYAGDMQFEVINMSFFVDDDQLLNSTEYKCMDDPTQRGFRRAVERAIQYARNQGVTPVAALGNSDDDLAHPPEPYENDCDVVPAETSGVIGTMALGPRSEKAGYSNYGSGMTDVAAPGGNGTTGNCLQTVPSTFPVHLGAYNCIQGTSMASPHSTGVAALIVSQFGYLGSDGDWKMSPTKVENYLQSTTVDIGLPGYDECFGNGRIDALRAVTHDTSRVYDSTAPPCPEYEE